MNKKLSVSRKLDPCVYHKDRDVGSETRSRPGFQLSLIALAAISLFLLPEIGIRFSWAAGRQTPSKASTVRRSPSRTQKRWLFIFKDLSNPAEVDRMIARFPAAQS